MPNNRYQLLNLILIEESFESLIKIIENTNDEYRKYLTNVHKPLQENEAVVSKNEIEKKISKCQQMYDEIVAKNTKIVTNNNNILSLSYNINDIQKIIENEFVQIKTTQYNDKFIQTKFYHIAHDSSYSICEFDLRYTELTNGSTINCDNNHIQVGSEASSSGHSTIFLAAQHVRGYSSGQHCFRMYYKNPEGPNQWLFFGIYKCGIVPKDMHTHLHKNSWGIGDGGIGQIYCNGKRELDKSNVSFLYSLNENQIDMLVDFDKGTLSYSIVDDFVDNRKYTFDKKFDTNIVYTVHLNLICAGTEVQVAKIHVDMFGKNKKLVKWPIEKY